MIHELPEPVCAAVVFGSRARGDFDSGSDTDLAAFAVASTRSELAQIKLALESRLHFPALNVSIYSTSTAEKMAADGSLFLWHLRLEGKTIYERERWLGGLLDRLQPYSRYKAHQDLTTFRSVQTDILKSLAEGAQTVSFEAATIFSVLRSLGMIASALEGKFIFSRLEPVDYLSLRMGESFPFTTSDVTKLIRAKLKYSRKTSTLQVIEPQWCRLQAEKLGSVINFVEQI